MAFNKKAERGFVNDLDSFSEKKRPAFEVGKNERHLSNYTSTVNKDHTDKQGHGFKNKTVHFIDEAGRAVEVAKPEENEAAVSNVDDKAILATVILHEKFKDDKKRFSEIHTEKKEFSEPVVEFADKGESFSDKYLNAFRDKKGNVFSEEYVLTSSDVINELNKHGTKGRRDEVKVSPAESGERLEDKFSETTVKADDNKGKKSVNSYFSEKSDTVGNHRIERMATQEKLDLSKSEKKSVKKAENKAIRKAAAIAAVSNMLRAKKEIQNTAGDMNPTGDLVKDGSAGMLRAAIDGIRGAAVNQIRGLLIKVMSAVAAGLMHIVVFAAPLIVVFVIVIAIMTSFLSIFTDSSNIPDGDGYVYFSLTGTEIDDIIDDLYMNFAAQMNGSNESLLRYALSRVGCAYDQDFHWDLTADIFDCSSLVYRAYRNVGIDISNSGIYSAAEICREAIESGYIAYGDLAPGDLIFYGGSNNGRFLGVYHVAIYVGNGKMVEARGRSSGVVYCDVRTNNIVGYSRYI